MRQKLLSFSFQFSVLSFRPRTRGTAAVETALVLPLYALILFGMIYFGYATITKTRQTVAASNAAWLPGSQTGDDLTSEFWSYAGNALQDTTVTATEDIALDDVYYGNEIGSQLSDGLGSLGGSDDTFDQERIAVSLWTLALGEVTQRFNFVPDQGMVEEIVRNYDDYARYLNSDAGSTGFIAADEGSPPTIGDEQRWIAEAYNGFGSGHWIERRQVSLDADYRPPFFRQIIRDRDAPPPDFSTFVSGDYPEPSASSRFSMTFDLTARGQANRPTADEIGGEGIVGEASDMTGLGLSEANSLDSTIQGAFAGSSPWVAQ